LKYPPMKLPQLVSAFRILSAFHRLKAYATLQPLACHLP